MHIEERKLIYYLPFVITEVELKFSKFKIKPFREDESYSHLLPNGIFDPGGSLIEINDFSSGDLYKKEVDREICNSLEKLKFGYFFLNPSQSMSPEGYISNETFECFRLFETNNDSSFEHKAHLSNGMFTFSEKLKTYYESRTSLKHNKIFIKTNSNTFSYVDYLSEHISDEELLTAMRLYNRCWSTYSLHNYIDKPVLARVSIEILAKFKYGEKNGLKIFIEEFLNTSFLKINQISNEYNFVKNLAELVEPNRKEFEKIILEHLNKIKDARHNFAHAGIESEELINIPFFLIWFPLFWITSIKHENITKNETIRLCIFFCLLKIKPEYWQHIDYKTLPTEIKHSHLSTYTRYSKILPTLSDKSPDQAKNIIKTIPRWFGI